MPKVIEGTPITRSDFDKLQDYSKRLRAIFERDGLSDKYIGETDYILRSAIEALGMTELFYERKANEPTRSEIQPEMPIL